MIFSSGSGVFLDFFGSDGGNSKKYSITTECNIDANKQDVESLIEDFLESKVINIDKSLVKIFKIAHNPTGLFLKDIFREDTHIRSALRSFILNKFNPVSIEYVAKKNRKFRVEIYGEVKEEIISKLYITYEKVREAIRTSVARELFRNIFYGNPAATVLLDLKSKVIDVNPQFTTLFGYEKEEIIGKDINAVLLPKEISEEGYKLDNIALKGYLNVEAVRIRKDGSEVNVLISGNPLILKGKIVGIIGTYFDITKIKEASNKITFLATHDNLTGLPNRHLLQDRFDIEKAQADRFGGKVGVFFIDVNKFKDINDIYGHSVGDSVLKEITDRLLKIMRRSDSVIRFGGDEFTIVADHIKNIDDAVAIANKIISAGFEPVKIDGTSLQVGLNVGVSLYPNDGTELEELLRKADIAMYSAKAKGENNFEFYSKQIEDARLKAISDLKMREIQFKLTFDKSPLATCIIDSKYNIFRANENFLALFELKVKDLKDKTILDICSSDCRQKLERALLLSKKGHEESFVTEIFQEKGKKYYRVYVGTLPALKSNETFFIVNLTDITESQLYLDKIEASQKALSTVVESSPIPMFVIDKNHEVILYNSAMEKFTGVKKSEIIGKYYMEVIFPDANRPSIADLIADGKHEEEIEKYYPNNKISKISGGKTYLVKDIELTFKGKKKIIDVYVSPIINEKGTIDGAIEVLYDITEQHQSLILQDVLFKITRSVIDTGTLRDFLREVYKIVTSILPTRNLYIGLKNGKYMDFLFFRDEKDKNPNRIEIGNSLTGFLFRNKKPVLYDKEELSSVEQKNGITVRGALPEWFLAVPLKAKGEMIGIIVAQSYNENQILSKNDLERLKYLSDEIALGILKKRDEEALEKLLKKEKELIEESRIFESVINVFEKNYEIDSLLKELISKLKELIPYTSANIAMIEDNTVRNFVSVGYEKYGISSFEDGLVQKINGLGEAQKAIKIKKPILISNTEKEKKWVVYEETKWIKSHITAPIVVQGVPIALLRIDSDKKNAFTKEHIKKIIPFANASAIALNRAKYIEQLKNLLLEKEDLIEKDRILLKMSKIIVESSADFLKEEKDKKLLFFNTLKELEKIVGADFSFAYFINGGEKRLREKEKILLTDFAQKRHISMPLEVLENLLRKIEKEGIFEFNEETYSQDDEIKESFKQMNINAGYIFSIGFPVVYGIFGFNFIAKKEVLPSEMVLLLKLFSIISGNSLTIEKILQEKLHYIKQIEKNYDDIVSMMIKLIEMRDPYTSGHGKKVSKISTLLAEKIKLDNETIYKIRIAALIHDIGKTSVPAEILSKPAMLNDIEFQIIKEHTKIGFNVLKSMEAFKDIARIVLCHHERLNGSGYPSGIKGDSIPIEARIIAVADVFDAMTSHRPYRPPRTKEETIEELVKNKGILYDPVVVDALVELVKEGKI